MRRWVAGLRLLPWFASAGGPVQFQAATDDQLDARFFGGYVGANHAGQCVGIGNRHGGVAELRSLLNHLFRMAGAGQKSKVGCHL